jgi:MoaA/NifB/PqqE/SkfB family radical SAM enzyme
MPQMMNFNALEKRVMKIIVRLVARYYLNRPMLTELISVKITTFKAGLYVLLNEICYLLGLGISFRLISLSIEVTNHCNLKCLMCPTSSQMRRRKGFMNEGLFRKIIDDNDYLEFIFLFQWGEPFLHPALFEFIKYASAKKIRTMLTTNGTICSDDIIRKILDSGLERLTFSVDGLGPTHTQIRGADYGQLKTAILKLKDLRDLKKSDLKIDVSMVVFEKTETDIDKFMKEWVGVADGIYLIPRFVAGARKKKCREMWRGNLTILWDGKIVPCCADFDGGMVIGNALKEALVEVWSGPRMKQLRRAHGQGVFPAICSWCGEYSSHRANPRFS